MLTSLHIRNFALIDELELNFGAGLNILTGETGAGKSIIIDALGTAIGERASADTIRLGADKLAVEATFLLDERDNRTRSHILENSLGDEDDDNLLVLSREIARSGKSQCRVNGRLVPVSMLRTIGLDLVDVHGQHEHQSLLVSETQIDILDNWLGKDVLDLKQSFKDSFDRLNSTRREIETLTREARDRARNLDLYRYQQNEIREAHLSADEINQLNQERFRLTNSEKLHAISEESYELLSEGALSSINSSLYSLQRAADLDPALTSTVEQITEASAYLEEGISRLRRYRDSLEPEPGRLETINERLDLIHSLQRKYGETVDEILQYLAELESKLNSLEDSEVRFSDLDRSRSSLEETLSNTAHALTRKREDGANKFSFAVESELVDLGMLQTRFAVSIQPQPYSSTGADRVEFVISTNPGEPLRPLARVASGGEASRIMLAIKSVLLRTFQIPTMIFDEIDTGVGGRTGRVIADKLSALSEIAQIMCITHLPQIASRPASAHFVIEKSAKDNRTTVNVNLLNATEREHEIARMLGGDGSVTVMQHAKEMLSTR
jgi:DNA repair protein RecN (Recombination protein N)